MISIDDNIPMPPVGRPGRQLKFPFDKLRVGQSFAVTVGSQEDPKQVLDRMRTSASGYAKRNGVTDIRFDCRVRDTDENGRSIPVEVRVWAMQKNAAKPKKK